MDFMKPGSPAHRYSALVLFILLIFVLALWVSSLLQQGARAQERYVSQVMQLQKYKQLVATKSEQASENQRLTALSNKDSRLLSKTSRSLALAEVQKRLQQVLRYSGASLVSMQAVEEDYHSGDGFSPIKMKLHVRLSHQALSTLLYQLESQTPIGFVYQLQVRRLRALMREQQSADDLLEAHLEYTLYMMSSNVV